MDRNDRIALSASDQKNFFARNFYSFEEYIEDMRSIILQDRIDLTLANYGEVAIANSPFSWQPDSTKSIKYGVLLIHGLFESPFQVRDLGEFFYQKNFLVRSILLPGHGTTPDALININYEEWLKAIEYGVSSLSQEVDKVILAGYSFGGLLALYHYLFHQDEKIKGLALFAPALQPRSIIKSFLIRHYQLFEGLFQDSPWFERAKHDYFTKYNCYALNAGKQASIIMSQVKKALKGNAVEIPMFVTMSTDDETISPKAVISFFEQQHNPKSKLLLYTNNCKSNNDTRIITRQSHFPDQRILNFSHTCMIISPENYYLGTKRGHSDLQSYRNKMPKVAQDKFYLGAVTRKNLKHYKISRLTYNPDFKNLLNALEQFLQSLSD